MLKAYQKAFACFSEDEISILEGVILEPVAPRAINDHHASALR